MGTESAMFCSIRIIERYNYAFAFYPLQGIQVLDGLVRMRGARRPRLLASAIKIRKRFILLSVVSNLKGLASIW